jgi:hopanoid biosynthesis associated protein HpnK
VTAEDQPLNRLIVTADDFGLAPEVNEAVEQAHRSGILTAASLMVAGPAAADAVKRAKRMPKLRVGLHVVLIEGQATLGPGQLAHIIDQQGRLPNDLLRLSFDILWDRRARREILTETEAQFRSFQASGLALDHVNAHKHLQLHPLVLSTLFAVARHFGVRGMRVPVEPAGPRLAITTPGFGHFALRHWALALRTLARRQGFVVPDAVFGLAWSGGMTQPRLGSLLRSLPVGMVEIYTHPATRDDFPGHAPGYEYRSELEALCSAEIGAMAKNAGYVGGGYADFASR